MAKNETKEEKEARLAKEAQEKAEAKAKADAAKAEEDSEKKPARYVVKSDLLHSGKSYKKGKHIKESDENFKHFQSLGHLRKLAANEEIKETEQA